MRLKGSCHCGAVKFEVNSPHPYPYNLCYCSICRKTAGGGGFAINLGAEFETLEISGKSECSVYHAVIDGEASPAERHFCKHCGSALWVFDPRWPDLVHPFASAIDTELPTPPQKTHLMLGSKADWVETAAADGDKNFDEYPDESLSDWHRRHGLESQ